jgi:hypothetical protein
MMRPLDVISSLALGRTTTRSPTGLILLATTNFLLEYE